jgi:RimJ/RimL family protein N-acetyltransferase
MDAEKRPLREWYAAIFDYPFNRMGVRKIIGQVNSNNIEAQNLDVNFGFTLEAELKDYYEDGASLLVYTLTRENCKILNSPLWERVVNKMSRAE